jgi:AcrR family transcriptional regulator
MEDFAQTLAFEVKKEIAERYFGFRKIIEEDSDDYQKEIISSTLVLETKIGFDLLRIYALLQKDQLIEEFYKLTKLGEVLFFDAYVATSPTIRKRLLENQRVRGLFRKSRFRNMFFDLYETLQAHIDSYRRRIAALIEEHEVIEEEIKLFYQKNDISGIMLFLRSLDGDGGTSGTMSGALDGGGSISIEDKMRLQAPQPVEKFLPILHAIPAPADIKSDLKALVNKAYEQQPDFDLKEL